MSTKLALFSDAHGNPIAFEACLRQARRLRAEQSYFLGDAVGYLPGEAEVLQMLAANGISPQQGNHEAMMLAPSDGALQREPIYGLQAARSRLADPQIRDIAEWPVQRELEVASRRILLVHGSPADPLYGYVYPDTNLTAFGVLPYDAVFMGNSHRPFLKKSHGCLFVNVGSVGLPRDQGNLATFVIYDVDENKADILRVPFDVDRVLEEFGGGIHHEVRDCFTRRTQNPVGRII